MKKGVPGKMYRKLLWLFMAVTAIPAVWSAEYIVPGDYPTILDAYRHAVNGDTIVVKPGVYHGDGWCEVQLFGKSVNVISEKGAAETVIDGAGVARGFLIKDIPDNEMVIDGFTFRDCVGEFTGAVSFFRYSPATLQNCVIIRGKATSTGEQPGEGGGIRIWHSDPIIRDCIILDCRASQGGGFNLLELSNPQIIRCVVSGCYGSGMQISTNCDPVIERCQITENTASPISWSAGIGIYDGSDAVVKNCLIAYNHNGECAGGGTRIEESAPLFENCYIVGNDALDFGGAILCRVDGFPVFRHCTIAGNRAGENGDGFATMIESNPEFVNCILWNAERTEFYSQDMGTAVITYSDIRVDFPGEGNINADPLFVSDTDFRLTAGSPCIDSGTDAGVKWDYDGEERPVNNGFDMGADEYAESGSISIDLFMPAHMFLPGDPCSLSVLFSNTGVTRTDIIMFLVLGFEGQYLFWPSWSDFDFDVITVQAGDSELEIFPEFTWPEDVGSASGVFFYAGLMDGFMSEVIGDIAQWEFGWDETPGVFPLTDNRRRVSENSAAMP